MNPAHVAAVREMYAAFRAGNIDAILAFLSPDVVWEEPAKPLNPAAGARRGHAGSQVVHFQEFFDTYAAGEAFRRHAQE